MNSLYDNIQSNVRSGNIVSDFFFFFFFDVEGVKKCCVLSPILFCLYINELSKIRDEHELGIYILGANTKCLFWADDHDVVLIADNEHDLLPLFFP